MNYWPDVSVRLIWKNNYLNITFLLSMGCAAISLKREQIIIMKLKTSKTYTKH